MFLSTLNCDYDVITLTETWLTDSITDNEMFSNDYRCYRADRSPVNSSKSRGGGVLIAIKSYLPSEVIIVPDSDKVELVLVKVKYCNQNLYIPPNSNSAVYYMYLNVLNNVFTSICLETSDICMVFGDFNLPFVDWISDSNNSIVQLPINLNSSYNSPESDMFNALSNYDLHQINNIFNYRGRLLDLIFSIAVDDIIVTKCELPLCKVDDYHPSIDVRIDLMPSCVQNDR